MLTTTFPGAWTQLRFAFSQWWMSNQHSENTYYVRHRAKNLTLLVSQNPKSYNQCEELRLDPEQSVLESCFRSLHFQGRDCLLSRLQRAGVKLIQHWTNQKELVNGNWLRRVGHMLLETTVTWDSGRVPASNPLTPTYRVLDLGGKNSNWASVFLLAKWE